MTTLASWGGKLLCCHALTQKVKRFWMALAWEHTVNRFLNDSLLKHKSKSLLESFFRSVPSLFHLLCLFPAPSFMHCAVCTVLLPPSPSALICPFPTLDLLPHLSAAFEIHPSVSNPGY